MRKRGCLVVGFLFLRLLGLGRMDLNFKNKQPLKIFSLKLGGVFEYKDAENILYQINSNEFLKHDHKSKPIYYLDYPLAEDFDKTGIVITVECNKDDGFYSPYVCDVQKHWIVFRKNIILKFLMDKDTGIAECKIYKKEEKASVFGFKAESDDGLKKIGDEINSK